MQRVILSYMSPQNKSIVYNIHDAFIVAYHTGEGIVMALDALREGGVVAANLCTALNDAGSGLANVPGLTLRLINENLWQERSIRTGERVTFTRFEDFVTTKPLEGLGATMVLLRRVCAGDVKALDALDRVTQRGAGGDRQSDVSKVDNTNIEKKPSGTSSARALRSLREKRPDLHALVLAGDKTPHGAMVEAGLREKTASLPVALPKLARALRKRYTPDEVRELLALLSSD